MITLTDIKNSAINGIQGFIPCVVAYGVTYAILKGAKTTVGANLVDQVARKYFGEITAQEKNSHLEKFAVIAGMVAAITTSFTMPTSVIPMSLGFAKTVQLGFLSLVISEVVYSCFKIR